MEVVQFIFSSFWVWLGAFMMLAVIFDGLGNGFWWGSCKCKCSCKEEK